MNLDKKLEAWKGINPANGSPIKIPLVTVNTVKDFHQYLLERVGKDLQGGLSYEEKEELLKRCYAMNNRLLAQEIFMRAVLHKYKNHFAERFDTLFAGAEKTQEPLIKKEETLLTRLQNFTIEAPASEITQEFPSMILARPTWYEFRHLVSSTDKFFRDLLLSESTSAVMAE